MVQYVSPSINLPAVKKQPYQPSSSEWAHLANFTYDLEPTNITQKSIIRGEDWIKSTWADCQKYLHQMFMNYKHSNQHDDDIDEWGLEYELKHWSRAASWKPAGTSSIIRYTSAMIYLIAVMDQFDIEVIGRRMPKGTGVDVTVDNGALVPQHEQKKRKMKVTADQGSSISKVLQQGDAQDAKMSALRMLLELGSNADKQKAKQELNKIAFGTLNATTACNEDIVEHDCDDSSATCSN
jgi:hypothetical protein